MVKKKPNAATLYKASNFLIWLKEWLFVDNLCAVNQLESWKFKNCSWKFNKYQLVLTVCLCHAWPVFGDFSESSLQTSCQFEWRITPYVVTKSFNVQCKLKEFSSRLGISLRILALLCNFEFFIPNDILSWRVDWILKILVGLGVD